MLYFYAFRWRNTEHFKILIGLNNIHEYYVEIYIFLVHNSRLRAW